MDGPGLTLFANGCGISGEHIYNFNSPEIDGKYIYSGNFLMFVGITTQKVRVLGVATNQQTSTNIDFS